MGPVVLFGTGGVDIELMKDTALAGASARRDGGRELISRTKAGVKLRGLPRQTRAARGPRREALVGLSNLNGRRRHRIASIDVNPFLINTRTGFAVDALIVLNNGRRRKRRQALMSALG